MYDGCIEHKDTAGNGGTITKDEVQWMTAGSGLLHNEFMTSEFACSGGIQHLAQLWVNLPKTHKMTPPRYQALTKEKIPSVLFSHGIVRVIAGSYESVPGAAKTFSPIELYDVQFHVPGNIEFTFPEGYNVMLLVVKGGAQVDGKLLQEGELAYCSRSGTEVSINDASDTTRILVMA